MLKRIICAAFLLTSVAPTHATTILDQINAAPGNYWTDAQIGDYRGTSFTVGKSGILTDIHVSLGKIGSPPPVTFFLAPIVSNKILISQADIVAIDRSVISPIYYGNGPNQPDWADLDFSAFNISVHLGDQFGLIFSAPIIPDSTSSTKPRVGWFGTSNVYAGGMELALRSLQDQEINISNSLPDFDMNFSTYISAVPEPTSWALLIVGFGMVGFSLRRSRRALSKVVV